MNNWMYFKAFLKSKRHSFCNPMKIMFLSIYFPLTAMKLKCIYTPTISTISSVWHLKVPMHFYPVQQQQVLVIFWRTIFQMFVFTSMKWLNVKLLLFRSSHNVIMLVPFTKKSCHPWQGKHDKKWFVIINPILLKVNYRWLLCWQPPSNSSKIIYTYRIP